MSSGIQLGLETRSVGGKRRPVGDFSINYYQEHQSGGRRMVIISDRRGLTGPAGPGGGRRVSPGDRRSPLTRRHRARSSRAQSTHPTRSFAFRCSADNSGLPELVFHVGRRTTGAGAPGLVGRTDGQCSRSGECESQTSS